MAKFSGIEAALRRDGGPVVVYGAGTLLSRATLAALRRFGIEPAAFADGRTELEGGEFSGLPVMGPARLAATWPDAHVFICLTREFGTVRDILAGKDMTNLYDVVGLLTEFLENGGEAGDAGVIRHLIHSHAGAVMAHGGALTPPLVNLIVTEFCSLNCLDCCNLMPYIEGRRHFPPEDLLAAAERLAAAVDSLPILRLIGGEPFVYPWLDRVIAGLSKIDKAQSVSIVTNGTVMPSRAVLDALAASDRNHVLINRYGVGPDRGAELATALLERGIAHSFEPSDRWSDMGSGEKRNRTADNLAAVYANCTTKACAVVMAGKVYNCARSAFGQRVGWLTANPAEEVDLFDPGQTVSERRERIRRLLFGVKWLSACDHCDGTGVGSPTIPPARQAARKPATRSGTLFMGEDRSG